ncbi:Hpt domain-containing protein [Methylocapsa sp. S129]|uniref:Hpt domain-containing protein n=1 Tax=Methylocapsa sp. S129 TaxID=1641869 RepID=UPI00131EA1DD|nr:Hpt domain-containing protein [Methylocapsa sp. S129]
MVALAINHSKSREYLAAEQGFGGGDEAFGGQEGEPVIDLVHLSRQTLSDQALEVELLDLFERQSARIVAQLMEPGAGDAKTRGDLAHTLRGSALAIGAGRVARTAQVYEASCAAPPRGAAAGAALAALAAAVAEARATIAQLLGH